LDLSDSFLSRINFKLRFNFKRSPSAFVEVMRVNLAQLEMTENLYHFSRGLNGLKAADFSVIALLYM